MEMDTDEDKIDEAVPAPLWLTRCGEARARARAWKGHDRDALDCLFETGMNPCAVRTASLLTGSKSTAESLR